MGKTRALIHLDRFARNLEHVRSRIGANRLICMPVKADAYGHGAIPIAEAGLRGGAAFLGVSRIQEGLELRKAGITAPIVLLSLPLPEELDEMAEGSLTPFVSDKEFAQRADAAASKAGIILPVHIKIDTGMGRLGCRPEDAPELACFIASMKSLVCTGTATHLSSADSLAEADRITTQKQLRCFKSAVEGIKQAGMDPGIVHAANSGAVLLHKDAYLDMVRPGILLYGYPPSAELKDLAPVEPVMELETVLVFLKKVKKGESISYGGTWTAPEDRVIGTLPVGYGDGLPRGISGNFQVLIQGKPYPLVGRICMDHCMVDLGSGSSIKRWDTVTVFGGNEGALDAGDIASRIHTIPYEITCNINKRVQRVYIDKGRESNFS
ncbi:MAG: alanine racemase [Treponema sp.]|nr:alanine racemase [Treponema sp.]